MIIHSARVLANHSAESGLEHFHKQCSLQNAKACGGTGACEPYLFPSASEYQTLREGPEHAGDRAVSGVLRGGGCASSFASGTLEPQAHRCGRKTLLTEDTSTATIIAPPCKGSLGSAHYVCALIRICGSYEGVLLIGKSEGKSRIAPRRQSGGKCVAPNVVHSDSRAESRNGMFRQNRHFRGT